MSEMDDVVSEFLVESYENLDRLDTDLVSLEENPQERSKLASIFRTIHTIKGTCGFLGFAKLERVAHVGENLLSKLRDGELLLDADITSSLLALVDAVRKMLGHIEHDGNEGVAEYAELVEALTRLAAGAKSAAQTSAAAPLAPAAPASPAAPKTEAAAAPSAPAATPQSPPQRRATDAFAPLGQRLVDAGLVKPEQLARALEVQRQSSDSPQIGQILVDQGAVTQSDLARVAGKVEKPTTHVADNSIRVDVGLLDRLMNLVGELVLARNQILQFTAAQTDSTYGATAQRLNLITTELQENVMKTRMQPIGNVWGKFPRVVRDLAVQCGKEVRIEMEGRETELDKTIIEAIKDPLTHIVRNSIDHGIEAPTVRTQRGKAREGLLTLRAYHEGGQVNIEITDDGNGVDVERVKKKALEKGLITPDHAARMGDRESLDLIFLPGFSTAQTVSNVSGRGVGMDVVRTNIEKIGGQVDLQNRPGQGMTIKIKIPLTLAIIPALLVTARGERFAIPQVSLLELVRLDGEQVQTAIETIHGAPVYRLRGRLLPLVHLDAALGLSHDASESGDGAVNIVVLQADEHQFGLVVGRISDTEEIVVKPLAKQLKGLSVYAGATIMGDGRVALILDVLGLAQRANVVAEHADRARSEIEHDDDSAAESRQSLLLFAIGRDSRMAMPLSTVARLEEFRAEQIEFASDQEVAQYRGQILPLVRLSRFFGKPEVENSSGVVQVIVYSTDDSSVGLVVDRILDIVDEQITVQRKSRRQGLLGSAVIEGKVTDLLDAAAVISAGDPAFSESLAAA